MAGQDLARRGQGGAVARNDPNKPRRLIFQNARIIFRNFSGKEGQYNREGDRNFALVLPPEAVEPMQEQGWNVKFLRAREEGDEPTPYLQISVSYRNVPPRVVLISEKGRTDLPEDMINMIDWIDIEKVDLSINPYQWAVNGRSGVKAYLHAIYVVMQEDELESKYAGLPENKIEGSLSSSMNALEFTANATDDEAEIEAELVDD